MADGTEETVGGFTWGETDEYVWIRSESGSYRRVDRAFLDRLLALAAGETALDELDAEYRRAVESLRDAGFIRDGVPVERVPTPDGIRLWPRLGLAFGATVGLVWLVLDLWTVAVDLPSGVGGWLLVALLIGLTTWIHEAGHVLASRPYVDVTVRDVDPLGFFSKVTETTEAWRCPRSVRIWISLAGPLANAGVALTAGLAYYTVTPSPAIATFVVLESLRITWGLHPAFGGDGYLILTDALGITDGADLRVRSLARNRPGAAAVTAVAVGVPSLVLVVGSGAFLTSALGWI